MKRKHFRRVHCDSLRSLHRQQTMVAASKLIWKMEGVAFRPFKFFEEAKLALLLVPSV